jgi:hypothetical protein
MQQEQLLSVLLKEQQPCTSEQHQLQKVGSPTHTAGIFPSKTPEGVRGINPKQRGQIQ